MFKSIFAKYITAFMLIIIFCFAMLTAITAVTMNNYAEMTKSETVSDAANTAEKFLEDSLNDTVSVRSDTDTDPLNNYITANNREVIGVLSALASNSDDITVLVIDNSGRILLLVNGLGKIEIPADSMMPADIMIEFNSGNEIDRVDRIEGVVGDMPIAGAASIQLSDGTQAGGVIVCAASATIPNLQEVMVKTILMSSLWVMLAALIAVYFITDRIISPLKDMRRAARSFAAGDLSVRVPVRGKDEVAELARGFNHMAESLESAERMRNSFMANVSHDLRTPMTTIAGFIDGILDGAIPPEKHEYYLHIITTEVRRLSRLVAQLLDISRIQAGDRKFNMEPFDVCEMARQILISFEQKIDDRHLDVEFDCDDDNMFAKADRDAIYQILYNICDNAVKFSYDGGKLLLGINYTAERRKITVTVYNEGQGIKEEDRPYVFERFYKGDKSRGLDKSGVGLGLYIAKTIIDAHGETINVDSDYGKYCRFSFTLGTAKDKW